MAEPADAPSLLFLIRPSDVSPETTPSHRFPTANPTAQLSDYRRVVADRPAKLDDAQAHYRASTASERCGRCFHLYHSKVADRTVCEVVRPVPEEQIKPDFVCNFFTRDGLHFPLVPEMEKGGDNGSS